MMANKQRNIPTYPLSQSLPAHSHRPVDRHRVHLSQASLVPRQQPTSLKLTKRADYYEQRCVKYPGRACFHSYSEFIHALLLEADGAVQSFIPQPYQLVVGRTRYVPDVYVVRSGTIEVLEIKPGGQFDERQERPLQAFFDAQGMAFKVVANETVLEKETQALNWLPLIQVLAHAHTQGIDTAVEEQSLLERARAEPEIAVGDLLPERPRTDRRFIELALCRLLHRHDLTCDLAKSPLDYNTVVSAWS